MFHLGLVSISFRKHSPKEIIDACLAAGLSRIEWGGDVHVPVGDLDNAREVRRMTEEAGLTVAAYGSYYHLGCEEDAPTLQRAILDTALALGTDRVRIWAGRKGSAATTPAERRAMVTELKAFAELAGKDGIRLCLECHNDTLTDCYESAMGLLSEVASLHLFLFWQPNQRRSLAYNIKAARAHAPYADHLHVFHWSESERFPLAEGRSDWDKYLEIFARRDTNLMLEFMHDDKLESLPETAATLASWVKKYNK